MTDIYIDIFCRDFGIVDSDWGLHAIDILARSTGISAARPVLLHGRADQHQPQIELIHARRLT
jgi:hypothetical protein